MDVQTRSVCFRLPIATMRMTLATHALRIPALAVQLSKYFCLLARSRHEQSTVRTPKQRFHALKIHGETHSPPKLKITVSSNFCRVGSLNLQMTCNGRIRIIRSRVNAVARVP